jgi:hypothetical protein
VATFTPPAIASVPPVLPDTKGPPLSLFRYYSARLGGQTVCILFDGTVLDPDNVPWDPDHTIIKWMFYGGHSYEVSAEVATQLTNAGYGACLS